MNIEKFAKKCGVSNGDMIITTCAFVFCIVALVVSFIIAAFMGRL